MKLLNRLFRLYLRGRERALDRMCTDPYGMQREQLRRIERLSGCSIAGVAPATYDERRPAFFGATAGRPARYAVSSGTTERSKLIPLTVEMLQKGQYRGSLDALLCHLREHGDTGILSGLCLTLGGSRELTTDGVALCGDLSAHMLDCAPAWSRWFKAPGRSTALIADFGEKVSRIVAETRGVNVTWLAGVPSWMLLLLHAVMRGAGVSDLREVWPGLELFVHGGVSFEPYRAQYAGLTVGSPLLFRETYNASEGFFGVQTEERDAAMQLMLDYGVYYEFEPVRGSDRAGGSRGASLASDQSGATCLLPLEAVETGVPYGLVISTVSGLLRYRIGDVVEFTTLRPYKFVLRGRTKLCINVWGEELMESNAQSALSEVSLSLRCQVVDYTACPVVYPDGRGRHHWLIELACPIDTATFSETLDAALRAANSDYDAKRRSGVLDCLTVQLAPPGAFLRWATATGRLGGQNKTPHLRQDSKIMDEIIANG